MQLEYNVFVSLTIKKTATTYKTNNKRSFELIWPANQHKRSHLSERDATEGAQYKSLINI